MNAFKKILTKPEFWPLLNTQALGAFNDNFFRAALISFVAFNPEFQDSGEKTILGALATGLMMLPFFLFSSLAGELADQRRKSSLIKISKSFEVGIMALAALFLFIGNINILLLMLFLMGTQSTFFGPLKYGLLPEVMPERDLVAANGLIEATTFLAIVLGTLAGSYLVTIPLGTTVFMPVGFVAIAVLGLLFALKQPQSKIGDPELKLNFNIWKGTCRIINSVRRRPPIWLAILAISWFWAIGSILITQLPVLCATTMGASSAVSTLVVTLVALGIGIGSMSAQWLLKGEVSPRMVPMASAFLALFLTFLALSIIFLPAPNPMAPLTLGAFVSNWEYLRLAASCLLVSITGGIFVVPLYAILQHLAETQERSRVIAANNIVNSFFICTANLLVMFLTWLGFDLANIFLLTALSGLGVSALTLYFLPAESLRHFLKFLITVLYQPKIKGLEHLEALKNGPALIVANHTSFLDVILLLAYFPRRLTFAIDSYWAMMWWLKPFLHIYKALPINPNQPLAARGLIEALKAGEMVVIFPEGRITTTDNFMKIYDGPGLIASKTKAPVVPVIIGSGQYTRFGKLTKLKNKPRKYSLSMTVLPPCALNIPRTPTDAQKDLRRLGSLALYDTLTTSLLKTMDRDINLWDTLTKAAATFGPNRIMVEDIERKPLSYRSFILRAKILGNRFKSWSRPGEKVGVMLPNSVGLTASLFALWFANRVPVMLNYSQGPTALASALKTAEVKTIISSRSFLVSTGLDKAELPAKLLLLDEQKFTPVQKLFAWLSKGSRAEANSPAVVVFTSGSEGQPKGVVLSHRNIITNINQMKCQLEITTDDILFNALPMFHAFGFTVGGILPLVLGLRSFNYISPLHTKVVPELIYDTRATFTCASDTFAYAWGKNANPYDFSSMRIMLIGAEKLKDKTKTLYADKLGLRLLEGYGATETSPVLTVNTYLHCKIGSVGRLLPGISARLEPVDGVSSGGRLIVKGPNIMMGYIKAEAPGVIVPPLEGWYDTGDIVEIDSDGFVWIKGRLKRFAKIGGEMVSLVALEGVMSTLWPGQPQVLVAVPDENKGEKVLLVTQDQAPDLAALWQALKAAGYPELSYPRKFVWLKEIPVTPLGKINLPRVMDEVSRTL